MKRLLIYFIYDKDGIIDDYIFYFLNAFKEYCEEICVVVNGKIEYKAKETLQNLVNKVIVRENIGYDSGAYKEALVMYGFENLKKYDEIILANFTMFGPIIPLEELFCKMDKEKVDFWGITKHPCSKYKIANFKITEHIQSYFIAYRKNLITSNDFKTYWDTIKTPTTYEEAIAFHELRNTEFFENLGYKSATFVNLKKYEHKLHKKPYFYYTIQQIKEDKMPFVKRKIFQMKKTKMESPIEKGAVELINFIEKETNYDKNLMLKNIKRTYFKNISCFSVIIEYLFLTLKKYLLPWHWNLYTRKRKSCIQIIKFWKILKKT